MSKKQFLLLALLYFGIVSLTTHAAKGSVCRTMIPDGLVGTSNWTRSGSPYCVNGDIQVSLLTIEPGVTVYITGDYEIVVSGVIRSNGTEGNLVVFKASNENNIGWRGFSFEDTIDGSEFRWTHIEDATTSAVHLIRSYPLFDHVTFQRNTSTYGGAIYAELLDENLQVKNSLFLDNYAEIAGGAIYSIGPTEPRDAKLVVTNCVFVENNAGTTSTRRDTAGGAIYANGNSRIFNSTFRNNESRAYTIYAKGGRFTQGGAIYSADGVNEITASSFINNACRMGAHGHTPDASRTYGGALYLAAGEMILKNCLVADNVLIGGRWPVRRGAGIYVSSGSARIINNTFIDNSEEAIHNSGGEVSVLNSILFFNNKGGTQTFGTVSARHSAVQHGMDGEGNIFHNPILDERFAPVQPSPAIDAGDPDPFYNDSCLPPGLGVFRNDMGYTGGSENCSIDLVRNDFLVEGALSVRTAGISATAQTGYAVVGVNSGGSPNGTAVFSLKEDGVTVSEVGVPASPPTTAARIFVDYRLGVPAIPGRAAAGTVDINTGVAIANINSTPTDVTYTLRNASGGIISVGHGNIDAGKHLSCFIDQLRDVSAEDFNLPEDFQTAVKFGTLDINSEKPLSVLALRGTYNQSRRFIMTTTPVADLNQSQESGETYFAQFVDGGGYTTTLILMNTSSAPETGTLEIFDNSGEALLVNEVGGTTGSSFRYSIPPDGIQHFQTDGFWEYSRVGWVRMTPDPNTSTPIGSGIFGYNPKGTLVTESGIPSTSATTHVRIYVDLTGNHNTGVAIANMADMASSITIRAYEVDGVTQAGTGDGLLALAAYGHDSKFANEMITDLPAEFTGVLDISSPTPFAALTVRSVHNETGDFLLTTFPVADMSHSTPSPIVFPHIGDGGGLRTEFFFISSLGASYFILNLYDEDGEPLGVGVKRR